MNIVSDSLKKKISYFLVVGISTQKALVNAGQQPPHCTGLSHLCGSPQFLKQIQCLRRTEVFFVFSTHKDRKSCLYRSSLSKAKDFISVACKQQHCSTLFSLHLRSILEETLSERTPPLPSTISLSYIPMQKLTDEKLESKDSAEGAPRRKYQTNTKHN